MNELIVEADGTVTCVGDAGTVSGIIAKRVKAATIPATYDGETELTPEVIPHASTLAVEVTAEELKTHAWRLPKARTEALERIRNQRNAKLNTIDDEIVQRTVGRPGANRTVENSADEKQTLRDLPPVAEEFLAACTSTDQIDAYSPEELA